MANMTTPSPPQVISDTATTPHTMPVSTPSQRLGWYQCQHVHSLFTNALVPVTLCVTGAPVHGSATVNTTSDTITPGGLY